MSAARSPSLLTMAWVTPMWPPANKTEANALEHGTHVAGIATGYDVNDEGEVLFSGVAPDAAHRHEGFR